MERIAARANSMHFGNVPFFAFIEVERWQIANVYVKTNKAAGLARKKGIDAAKLLVNEKVDVVLAGGMGEGPFHLLRDNLVQVYTLQKRVARALMSSRVLWTV
jgi:predicted Fe-Mo cluster-binding NifX family protein